MKEFKKEELQSSFIFKGRSYKIYAGILNLSFLGIKEVKEINDSTSAWKLTSLKELNLQKNQITEITSLDKLTNLKELNLSNNRISKINEFQKLKNLEKLYLHSNQIAEIKGLSALKKLKILNLADNKISEIKGLENLTNLEELYLGNNQITEIKELNALKKLKILNLADNKISEIKGLENLTNLEKLYISNNQITEIKGLELLINLKELYLIKNQISEIKGLENLTNLKELGLSENKISEIEGLENLINLEDLYLRYNQIDEIRGLENLNNIYRLEIDYNKIVDIKWINDQFGDGKRPKKFVEYCRLKKKGKINFKKNIAESIINFRGVLIPEIEAIALEKIEEIIRKTSYCLDGLYYDFKFVPVKEYNKDPYFDEIYGQFVVENNRITELLILDLNNCDMCYDYWKGSDVYSDYDDYTIENCYKCGLISIPEVVNRLNSLKKLYILRPYDQHRREVYIPNSIKKREDLKVVVFNNYDYIGGLPDEITM